jgi:predicted RNase H-like nuclease (RuvC/YqgF family)
LFLSPYSDQSLFLHSLTAQTPNTFLELQMPMCRVDSASVSRASQHGFILQRTEPLTPNELQEMGRIVLQHAKVHEEADELRAENVKLRSENTKLREDNVKLHKRLDALEAQLMKSQAESREIQAQVKENWAQVRETRAQMNAMQAQFTLLQNQMSAGAPTTGTYALGSNSGDSNKRKKLWH